MENRICWRAAVSQVVQCLTTDWTIGVRSPTWAKDFSSIPCIQPLIQWVPKGVKRGRCVTLTTHPHLVPRLSMSRALPPLPPCAPMACSGYRFTFY
jgi:hypothetical protein